MSPTSLAAELSEAARTVDRTAGPSVVRIGRHGGRGCGIVVAEGHVLTNAHNLRVRTTEVTFAAGRTAQAEVVAADRDGDLVVLRVDTGDAPVMRWAESTPDVGDVVFTAARTAAGSQRVSFGMASAINAAFRGPRGRRITGSLEHTAPLARGSSGSPVVNEAGELLALNTARLGEGFYLALPADAVLRERVDALVRGEAPERLLLGLGLAPVEVARELRASVGLPPVDGLLVRTVAPASPAGDAGIQVGDLVVAAAGRPVTGVDSLHEALDGARATRTLELGIVRGADDLTVTVTFPAADS
jgi:S1-C subfamily serine protease